jgi:hypothetical protein
MLFFLSFFVASEIYQKKTQQFYYMFLCGNLIVNVNSNVYQACKACETKCLQNFDWKSE